MSQQVSQTVQEGIDELVPRTREKEEERKKRKKALLVDETASTSQRYPSRSDKGQETTTMSMAGRTISIKRIIKGDESMETKKMDDELGQEKEIDVEEQEEVDTKECGKTTDEPEDESTDNDELEDKPTVVEFEDPVYELS